MKDLTHPTWIKIKGSLFVILGLSAGTLLYIDRPGFRTGLLLVICVWSFCRFYYFGFYVIERYVDSSYRFSGLLSLARYLFARHDHRPKKQ